MTVTDSPRLAMVSGDATLIDRAGDAAAAANFALLPYDTMAQAANCGAKATLVGVDVALGMLRDGAPRAAEALVVGRDGELEQLWQMAVDLGAAGAVSLPSGSAWLVQWLHSRATSAQQRDTVVCAVVGAAGGVGASTLTASLAVTAAAHGLGTLLIDAHPGPAGVELLLGDPGVPDHWTRFAGIRGFLSPEALTGLPVLEGVRCLGWGGGGGEVPLWQGALGSVLSAARRDHDLVVLDAGMHGLAWEELPRRTRPVLLIPASWRGALAAQPRLTALRGAFEDPPVVVLRDVGGKSDPASYLRDFPGCRVLSLDFDPTVIDDEESCRPPGTRRRSAVGRVSREVLAVLARRPAAA